ncbi:hypothetical protein A2331_03690 [Candidatus Falkowbacteria bacterium RIFOXYB2_FULL_34_18]|uniref:Uncharacterized protein n=1 Tax=Candidatus Falkowbacteria bacterium RIFOXYD2_FULL_34_120 TaxID=1798007 RepID=A0A1F5TSA4_9BACT|nr:MAG: hypothetical protein A2331_03690 [Candidatus Falkowbacteria bacterium RIFOXYB2_FULL_34_18]OGF30077.1 MAG: hypothetical protein A2500_04760 [Candidatus Falkowbacteria bacterium RIFOXYC12_FULL_34_55]OGF37589.1 MAG: hypothetical protein A2466_02085 [Candidatus Falkowbacteria bacterium RIFOXYC2_FULL_34_220]OGF39345.1 MAG: hypothetical protein A2515_02500 [Candidatus Falkowbacteria bacterium RIFOXYD12_FULL_34_57]OGF41850.1 MAG: hypothetical protein A2531_05485 [Candidatus Falkowbacteria bact
MTSSPDGVIKKIREENAKEEKIDKALERIKGVMKKIDKLDTENEGILEEILKKIEEMADGFDEYADFLENNEIENDDE